MSAGRWRFPGRIRYGGPSRIAVTVLSISLGCACADERPTLALSWPHSVRRPIEGPP
jgi:hypothetical protein